MNVLVDTGIWSLLLRRRPPDLSRAEQAVVAELRDIAGRGGALMMGAIRQEILSGISDRPTFDRLRDYLRAFDDVPMTVADHEVAASFANELRARGIRATHVDALICAVAARLDVPIFTTDSDYDRYEEMLPVVLHRHA